MNLKLPKAKLRDEAEMRAFYRSVGVRPETTEAAIKVINKRTEEKPPSPMKGRRRKPVADASG
jgi:hypothetical protein